ncbi:hypothetical protein DERF_002537 [Dermatophagoides farinae]|uniref:Uncharacterized protein n=1 Tax=Dermatophagoides farinae TaxID=6954 RepID=A0A922LDC2_DERFA|nr:hypothetical protein DERF_002537 [Dermatophagoides farinae]
MKFKYPVHFGTTTTKNILFLFSKENGTTTTTFSGLLFTVCCFIHLEFNQFLFGRYKYHMKTFNDWFPSTATYYKPGEMFR